MTDSNRSRVLITDDEKDVRDVLSTLLRIAGFETIEAENGMAALRILREDLPAAMLLDIGMPGMNGMQVLHETGKLDSASPIIMLTAFGSIHSAVDAMREGAFDYLTKPFDNEALISVVQRAVCSGVPRPENVLEGRLLAGQTDGPQRCDPEVIDRDQTCVADKFHGRHQW